MPKYRKGYVDLRDGQLHHARAEGVGTPVTFLHQTASSWEMWRKVMDLLHPGPPLLAFDTPGFGASFDPEGEVSMARYAGWIAEALDALGIMRMHVVGHHTGAAIGAELATLRPDLAASLTLFGPLALTRSERIAAADLYGAPFTPEPTGAYLEKTWRYLDQGGASADPLLINREMVGMLRAHANRPYAYGAVWEQDFESALLRVSCPLLIACAPDDVLWTFFGAAKTLRPDAVAVQLPEGGTNFCPDLIPSAVAEVIAMQIRAAD